jgi:transposase InsO family protein
MALSRRVNMPWKEANVMDLRTEFVTRALREETSFAELCRSFGISTKTGYKWKQRFLANGQAGLTDRSRRPQRSPTLSCEDVICALVALKDKHDSAGPKKILAMFQRQQPQLPQPALSTVKRILAKAGLTQRRRRRPSASCGQLVNPVIATAPNEVWTVDFKGSWYTPYRERVLPLTVMDAYSCQVLLTQIVPDARMETIQECFKRLFSEYGLPLVIRSDNGAPFACTSAPRGLSRLAAWWVSLGISLDRIDKGHPEQNGRHERMHREIAQQVECRVRGDLVATQAALDSWRHYYNHERPHEALGMKVPAELYVKSPRRYNPQPVELEYPPEYWRRRVTRSGCIKLGGRLISISVAVSGWHVGLQPQGEGEFKVWFGRLYLGSVKVQDEKFTAAS